MEALAASSSAAACAAALRGSRLAPLPATPRACRGSQRRRQGACASLGRLGFHEEPLPPSQPRAAAPPSLYGLSDFQMQALGLTGDEVTRRLAVCEASVSARAAYGKEIPSMHSPPTRMVTSMAGGGGGGGGGGPQAPPDLPSLLLNARICYLGMPLVPSVTELIVAELLWLGSDNPEKPVYFYVNSTGSQTPEGQSVGFETEAYAIMDTMQYIRPDIHTVCIGKAYGNAAMLLASGKKGCRYALPNSSIMLCPPRMNRKVDSATNLMIQANELYDNTGTYLEYLTEFTGKERSELEKDIARTNYFTPQQAVTYGLIDKVVNQAGGLGAALEKKDYEAMMKAQQGGGRPGPAYAGSRGGD